MLLKELAGVAIGGALGSLFRFILASWFVKYFSRHTIYPLGVLVCNVLGCLLAGFFVGFFIQYIELSSVYRTTILVGFLGGFTTFSTFAIDVVVLFQRGFIISALSNIILTLFLCIASVFLGLFLSKLTISIFVN